MCGIFSIISKNKTVKIEEIIKCFEKGIGRGPEESHLKNVNDRLLFGFHRLAINGYNDPKSMQPLMFKNCILICNGEIYNWKYLYKIMKIKRNTNSDCEVIIHTYKKYGMLQTLQLLDGVFAFILFDKANNKIFVARDTYGVRPLFWCEDVDRYLFASEMKSLIDLPNRQKKLNQFTPGSCIRIDLSTNKTNILTFSAANSFNNTTIKTEHDALTLIRSSLIEAVRKRVDNTDREVACLLSGGLDSSLIAGLVKKMLGMTNLHTFSIGMNESEDLKYAEKVATYIGSIHHTIRLTEQEFLDAIDEVIYSIESYDITTVRASVGNWLVSKFIKENSQAKVIFNGDGSDEVCGGYMYFHAAPDSLEFDKECRRLLNDIHFFDVLRSDRSISSHGLEARTPFLDRCFVQNYLSIPHNIRYHPGKNQCEKYLLRKAFEEMSILPREVLFRTKEAFSDGVSKQSRSWYEIVQEYIVKTKGERYSCLPANEAEKLYYKDVFDRHFPNHGHVIPYFWMPKFVEAKDASARTLKLYADKMKN